MSEELVIQGDNLYILFESSAKRYRKDCKNVQETVWAVNLSEITVNRDISELADIEMNVSAEEE